MSCITKTHKCSVFTYISECSCPDDDCKEFGLACDGVCNGAGHRDADGWYLKSDGRTLCTSCNSLEDLENEILG